MKKQGIMCLAALSGIVLIGCSAKEIEEIESDHEVFSGDRVYDLGDHKIVYFSNENVEEEGEKDWLVLQDLESQEILYIPDPLVEISGVEIYSSEIYLEYQDEDGKQEKLCIPAVFSDKRNDVFRMHYYSKDIKVIQVDSLLQPETVWEEKIIQGDTIYQVSLARVSLPYHGNFEWLADYTLEVQDEEQNTVWSKNISMPIPYEEVYWLQDISDDGFCDLIFCKEYVREGRTAECVFFVWNGQEEGFQIKESPVRGHMGKPQWNEDISGIVFFEEGYNRYVLDLKAYVFDGGSWKLYADNITHSDDEGNILSFPDAYEEEIYYKELDYYEIETFYEDGKAVKENVGDEINIGQGSIWNWDQESNLQLYPGEDWDVITMEISDPKQTLKYVRKDK